MLQTLAASQGAAAARARLGLAAWVAPAAVPRFACPADHMAACRAILMMVRAMSSGEST
jgi:hypothetical protein